VSPRGRIESVGIESVPGHSNILCSFAGGGGEGEGKPLTAGLFLLHPCLRCQYSIVQYSTVQCSAVQYSTYSEGLP
jgi:hypothetical protein